MAIESSELVKEYARRGNRFFAVDQVSLSVPKGKVTAVMGHSGSGKSTLAGILAGMISPDAGEVTIDGVNLFQSGSRQIRKLRAGRIGVVPQSQSLIGGLTVAENIKLHMGLADAARGTRRGPNGLPEDLIQALGLEEILNVLPHKLSGGEMKRVAIARALAADPEYIIADEPTGELDEENAKRVVQLFRKEAERGKGILLITHDKSVGESADRIYRMGRGKLQEAGEIGRSGNS